MNVSRTGGKCPECGLGELISSTRTEEFDFDFGGEIVRVRAENVPIKKCDNCGEEMIGPEGAWIQHEAICRAVGLLTPTEIKAIREQLGWSQQRLAELTHFGIATISRWERGRLLQNRSNNKFLQGIRDCPPFRKYLEQLVVSKTSGQAVTNPPLNGMDPRSAINRLHSIFEKINRNFDLQITGNINEIEILRRFPPNLMAN